MGAIHTPKRVAWRALSPGLTPPALSPIMPREPAMLPVCPQCDRGLIVLQFKSVEVDYCGNCQGVWLDAGEFEALMEVSGANPTAPLPRQAASRAGQRLCPRCDARMQELSLEGNLELDRCPQGHGLWFDAEELPRLLRLCPAEAQAARTIAFLNDMFGKSIPQKENNP